MTRANAPTLIRQVSGFTIVELILVAGISGVVLLAMMTSIGMMFEMQAQQNLVFTRNEIAARIRITALTPGSLENSAIMTNALGTTGVSPSVGVPKTFDRFEAMLKCHPAFTDPAQMGCDRTVMDDSARGNYFYLSDRNSTDPALALAGEYIHYTGNGARCTQVQAANANECPVFARVWAEPFCLNFAETCNKAMSFSIRYSVGIRDDFQAAGQRKPTTIDGEVTVLLQKGLQIARILDQDNNPLVPNAKGMYGVQKYFGYPDQAASPRALRFEVLVGNPAGLVNIRVQMRKITGPDAKGYDALTIPPAMNSLSWVDVPNPDNAAQSWVIPLNNASQGQVFNFGTVNTVKGFLIGARYDLPNTDARKRDYLYHFSTDGSTLLEPAKFKSGIYQFRVIALDNDGNEVESTNYATVRIFSRPQMYLAPATGIPSNLQRNCIGAESQLNLTMMVADDEELATASYTVTAPDGTVVGGGAQTFSATTGAFPLVFDKSQPAGTYSVATVATNLNTGIPVQGVPIPATQTSTMPASLLLKEVVPVTDLVWSPAKIRINSNADATFSYTTGNCCTTNPTVAWTFPNVPEVGNVPMLTAASPTETLTCALNVASGTRTCTATTQVKGVVDGPAAAAPNISSALVFTGPIPPACQVTSSASLKYIPVIRIPGVQLFSKESMWLSAPAGGSMKPQSRIVRVKLDFPPESQNVVLDVQKPDGTPVCSDITFPPGPGVDPVVQGCTIPAGYNGDLILARVSPNIKTSADLPGPAWQAALVDGSLNHRVCSADIGAPSGAFPTNYTIPFTLPMLNSPWGLNNDGTQKAGNDTGLWNAGASRSLRCWDTWTGFSSANNVQDGFYTLDTYNAGKPFPSQMGIKLQMAFPAFFFPYNGGPAPDFNAKNVPYLFTVSRGFPASATYTFNDTVSGTISVSLDHPWTNVTANYCTGSSSMSQVQLWVNQLEGFDTTTQTMKAANGMSNVMSTGTNYQYTFLCTYGRYNPNGEGP